MNIIRETLDRPAHEFAVRRSVMSRLVPWIEVEVEDLYICPVCGSENLVLPHGKWVPCRENPGIEVATFGNSMNIRGEPKS